MATNKTISQILKVIAAAYPRFELSEETVMVWARFLSDLDDDLLEAAVAKFISSSDHAFPPSIPEIRRAASDIRRAVAGVPTAFEAWEEVVRAPHPNPIRQFKDGAFVEPTEYEWSHPLVGMVAKQLGWWRTFPNMSADKIGIDRAHFIKAYDAAASKKLDEETQLPKVTAYIEQSKIKALDVTGEIKKLTEARTA
jgi:hypothetical protein